MANTGKYRSKSRSKNKSKNKSKSRSKSRSKNKSRSSSKNIKGGGAAYVGSIQGNFINRNGQQLFRNPTGGIA